MAIDSSMVDHLRSTFFEEAEEGLEVMETCLLDLEAGPADPDLIHRIFRAIHSIKGGSGSFGMTRLVEFSHLQETLLDGMREGRQPADADTIALLLRCVDQLRLMLNPGADPERPVPEELMRTLQARVGDQPVPAPAAVDAAPPAVDCWLIHIEPGANMLTRGSDPLLILRELEALGSSQTQADTRALPPFAELVPNRCDLRFDLILSGAVDLDEIRDILVWGEDCVFGLEATREDGTVRLDPITGEAVSALSLSARPEANEANGADGADGANGANGAVSAPASPSERSEAAALAPPPSDPPSSPPPPSDPPPKPQPPPPPPPPARPPRSGGRDRGQNEGSIRVAIDRVDTLVNMVGELVIIQSMLGQIGRTEDEHQQDRLRAGLAELERTTRLLQEAVMRVRMLPIRSALIRFPRVVHDLGARFGKKVKLSLSGEYTELDKTVMEKIGDPLMHLVRNAIDHGLETPLERAALGKPEVGTLAIRAYYKGGYIVIEVEDDGAGIDSRRILDKAVDAGLAGSNESLSEERILDFIFYPGLSTRDTVSDISGRGVGMDVVRRNIRALGGTVTVQSSRGEGTIFAIRLPLTLAIIDGQLVRVEDQTYVIPLAATVETLRLKAEHITLVTGGHEFYRTDEGLVPIVRLYERFGLPSDKRSLAGELMTIVDAGERQAGLIVDELLGQQQVVVKSLEANFRHIPGISGATILGDGRVALIFDVPELIEINVSNTAWTGQGAR